MLVAVYYSNQDIRLEEIPKPKIGPGEILVKVKACGICGSDVMEWYRIKRAPLVLGHEATGEIVEITEGIKGYKIGDRVFVSHHVPCNSCHYCLLGYHTACQTLHNTNYYPGGFSEYIRVPSINVDRGVFILPEEISFEEGTFIEPLACVVRAQRIINLKPGQSVIILGSGISGLLHLLLARNLGVECVIMTDINEYRLNIALEFGATAVINVSKNNIVTKLREFNENRLADLVIICATSSSAFMQSLQVVDRGGTILCFAPTEPNATFSIPVNDFWRKNIKIIHSYGNSPSDAMEAIELLRKKILSLEKMITHRLSLKEIGLGFKLVSETKECIKVIIQPDKH